MGDVLLKSTLLPGPHKGFYETRGIRHVDVLVGQVLSGGPQNLVMYAKGASTPLVP